MIWRTRFIPERSQAERVNNQAIAWGKEHLPSDFAAEYPTAHDLGFWEVSTLLDRREQALLEDANPPAELPAIAEAWSSNNPDKPAEALILFLRESALRGVRPAERGIPALDASFSAMEAAVAYHKNYGHGDLPDLSQMGGWLEPFGDESPAMRLPNRAAIRLGIRRRPRSPSTKAKCSRSVPDRAVFLLDQALIWFEACPDPIAPCVRARPWPSFKHVNRTSTLLRQP